MAGIPEETWDSTCCCTTLSVHCLGCVVDTACITIPMQIPKGTRVSTVCIGLYSIEPSIYGSMTVYGRVRETTLSQGEAVLGEGIPC